MDSKLDSRSLLLALSAVALGGAAFYLSSGLNPWWWPIWFAPLPLLWMSPRLSWLFIALASVVARVIGGLRMWNYLELLHIPPLVRLAWLLIPAVAFSLGVLLFRGLMRRGKPWLAAIAFPSLMVSYEYLISLGFGTFGTTAYTQMKNVALLQLGALTGLWGISFAVMQFPSMIAVILLSHAQTRRSFTIVFVVIFGCLFGYGLLRQSTTPREEHAVVVGLVASDLPKNIFPKDDPEAMQLMHDYAQQVKLLAQRGAKIVVLPEMTALIRDSISGEVDQLFQETARIARVQVLLGVLHVTSNAAFNEARLYSETGTIEGVYRKHHLVPVVEGSTTPGTGISVLPQSSGILGLTICRDMDYPDPARLYGNANAGLVLVPAWDFDVDRAWHGHMAILRGVENGFTIVRAAKQGLLTVSDDRGRILAEARTTPQESFTSLLTTVPVRHDATLYQSWGDWFAWLNLATLAVLMIVLARRRSDAALLADDRVQQLSKLSA